MLQRKLINLWQQFVELDRVRADDPPEVGSEPGSLQAGPKHFRGPVGQDGQQVLLLQPSKDSRHLGVGGGVESGLHRRSRCSGVTCRAKRWSANSRASSVTSRKSRYFPIRVRRKAYSSSLARHWVLKATGSGATRTEIFCRVGNFCSATFC